MNIEKASNGLCRKNATGMPDERTAFRPWIQGPELLDRLPSSHIGSERITKKLLAFSTA
jgi:hypothetical protein